MELVGTGLEVQFLIAVGDIVEHEAAFDLQRPFATSAVCFSAGGLGEALEQAPARAPDVGDRSPILKDIPGTG